VAFPDAVVVTVAAHAVEYIALGKALIAQCRAIERIDRDNGKKPRSEFDQVFRQSSC